MRVRGSNTAQKEIIKSKNNNDLPKVSVIIPCYNQEKYIAECLDSVLAQTLMNFEAIVVNDGSTDKSAEIIAEYAKKDKRIKVITQENQGVVVARNNAISQAHGKYIYPLDGDDKIAPTCLEELYQAMCQHKGDVIYSLVQKFGNKTGISSTKKPTAFNMSWSNQVVNAALFSKDDWEKYGGYDPHMKGGLEDWEFWLNFVFDNKKFYRIEKPLFFYRILSISRSKFVKKNQSDLKKYMSSKYPKFKYYRLLHKFLKIFYNNKIRENLCIVKIFGITVFKKTQWN